MSEYTINIPKDAVTKAGHAGIVATIMLGDDVLFTATIMREDDGSLYYHMFEEADLDGDFAIDRSIPAYFTTEYCGHIYDSYCGKCGLSS